MNNFEIGRLNIESLKAFNWGLLCKGWWRFKLEKESVWVKIIKSIYGVNGDIIRVGNVLEKNGIPFAGSFGRKVGDGSETVCWLDIWIDNFSLYEKFLRPFHLESQKFEVKDS